MSIRAAYWGHHRCGSQWITAIVNRVCSKLGFDYIQEDHAMWFPTRGQDYRYGDGLDQFVVCWNSDFLSVRTFEGRAFHVIRDPRDVVVSGYFAHLDTHGEEHWPRLSLYRQYLKTLDREEGLLAEMHFSSTYLHQMFWWDYDNPAIVEKRFEDVIADPLRHFGEIFSHLQIPATHLSEQALAEIVEQTSFTAMSGGRNPGDEDVRHHYRRGVPGEWRTHFSRQHAEFFKHLFNPLLLKTGYEETEDW
jgi:hypothetical protein